MKLISLNSQHFDFEGCNFTVKNMYYKDKREGLSKEGSGRVALYKATGLIHSYTLECNYACGRVMNTMAPAANNSMYNGRISPPQHTELPPKFLPEHYQNVGKGLAVAALDMIEMNPCTRVTNTTFGSLDAVRNWVKFYIRTKSNNNNKRQSLSFGKPQLNKISQNNEIKQTGRRNTAPSSKVNCNEVVVRRFVTQLSTPNNSKPSFIFKESKIVNDNKLARNNATGGSLNKRNERRQINRTPVADSKNFVRKTTPSVVEVGSTKTKSVNDILNSDDEDFREFNNFIHENYDDNSDKEELIINEEIEDLNQDSEGVKLTRETSWFLRDNDNDRVLSLNKPDSRLQRLNSFSKGLVNPVRELFPLNKAQVIHNDNDLVFQNNFNYDSMMPPHNKGNNSELAKQYMPKNLNNQFYQKNTKKQGKSQTIKAIYNTTLIKKFLNTNKMQLCNKGEVKSITNEIIQQNEQQFFRSTSQLQSQQTLQQDLMMDNLDSNKFKKKVMIDNKNIIKVGSNKKTLQASQVKNQASANNEAAISQFFDDKKMKKRRLKENARKVEICF